MPDNKIQDKNSLLKTINNFVKDAQVGELKTKKYKFIYNGFHVKASFGQGTPTKVPWIGFYIEGQTNNINILYYKEKNKLILVYGIPEEKKPTISWELNNKTVAQYYENDFKPYRYGNSLFIAEYDPGNINESLIKELDEALSVYKKHIAYPIYSNSELTNLMKRFISHAKEGNNTRFSFKGKYRTLMHRAWFGTTESKYLRTPWIVFGKDNHEKGNKWKDDRIVVLYKIKSDKLILIYKWENSTGRYKGLKNDPTIRELTGSDEDWPDWQARGIYKPEDLSSFEKDFNVLVDEYEKHNVEGGSKMHAVGLNTIIYGPPGTGKTYSIKKIKEGILANQTSRYEGLIKGTVKDTLLFLYKSDNTSKTASDIWRDENFQKLQQYNGRTRSNSGAVYNELENNRDLFNRYEHDGRVIYNATENGLDYIRTKIEGQNNEPTPEADDFYEFITFHQSYGYEEFVEGIRAETNDSGNISYAVRDGVFKSFCRRAESDPENNYLFAIDEINRGNISKIFGELITLLEPDKRLGSSEQLVVTLPYSGEKFGVPKNVYVVGTMNTADRSIALLDIALRRRFDFMEVMPNLDLVSEDIDGVNVRELLASINSRIVEKIDRNHQIGHSYLMGVNNIGELSVAWYQRIIPLLQEYFYDDNNDLKDVIKSFINNDKVEILSGEDFKEALKDIYNENTAADPGIQL